MLYYNNLNCWSAFPFESYLGKLRKRFRGTSNLSGQAVNRVQEMNHSQQPSLFHNIAVKLSDFNNVVLTTDGIVRLVEYDVVSGYCKGYLYTFDEDLYTVPYRSSVLEIGYFSSTDNIVSTTFISKCIVLQYANRCIIIPLSNSTFFG